MPLTSIRTIADSKITAASRALIEYFIQSGVVGGSGFSGGGGGEVSGGSACSCGDGGGSSGGGGLVVNSPTALHAL